jgi:hypothetical protein
VHRPGDRVIEASIMTGNNIGLSVAIPRIVLNSSSVGVYLKEPIFTHGQLYVAVCQ